MHYLTTTNLLKVIPISIIMQDMLDVLDEKALDKGTGNIKQILSERSGKSKGN